MVAPSEALITTAIQAALWLRAAVWRAPTLSAHPLSSRHCPAGCSSAINPVVLVSSISLRRGPLHRTHWIHMHSYGILVHMRTTIILNEELLKKAQELSGLREKTTVLHAGLQALISRESARRLAALGKTKPTVKPIPRRRSRQGK